MLDAHFHDWLSLAVRWIHLITGIAWIGASFYFNWLENHLERLNKEAGIAGDLWAIHGGGFYYLKKYQVAPPKLPETLHWFKWEAYATWISGFALLSVVYYSQAQAYMINPQVMTLSSTMAVSIGIASMLVSWLFYDLLCRSPLSKHGLWLGFVIFAYFVFLSWGLSQLFSGRAAFIHVGASIGTIMVANVFRVIIPSQKDLVDAVSEQRAPDPQKGKNALLRSRHNNYFTLPVLFIMISSHYSGTYGHGWNWLILVAISAIGIAVRHYFNIRHLPGSKVWILPVAILALAALAVITRPPQVKDTATVTQIQAYSDEAIMSLVKQRCTGCHSAEPSFAGFPVAPVGLTLDSMAELTLAAERVYGATVATQTMPLGNLTQMTDEERQMLSDWYQGLKNKTP